MKFLGFLLFFFITLDLPGQIVYHTENLIIHQLTGSVFIHETFLDTDDYGKVSCNGMVVLNNGEAVIADTPSENTAAVELIKWLEDEMKVKIKAVVVNHHHIDCLGSLALFHQENIPSYSSSVTAKLAAEDGYEVPQNTFKDVLELRVGKLSIVNQFFGPAHAPGNIISCVKEEGVIFGGCMIKSLNAGKGNLADADIEAWSETLRKTKQAFPSTKYVIPGHGKSGGMNLIDYTIKMFE